jgi:hypothetical protein
MKRVAIKLLVFLLLGAIVTGAMLFAERQAAHDHATRVIAENGAAITKPRPTVTVVVLETGGGEKWFGDQHLLAIIPVLGDVHKFAGLSLPGTSVSDTSITQLRAIPKLQRLDISNTNVSVDGLMQLQGMPNLRSITFEQAQFTPRDLDRLRAGLPSVNLRELPPTDRRADLRH